MSKYYSQHGEDFLVDQVFKGKTNGFYVEIGCLDGIEFSNTYFFEKKGWDGICVEAHKDFIEMLKVNRKHSQIVHCAVGEKDQDNVIFYANKIGSLSTLDKTEEERWKKNYTEFFTGFEEQQVKMRTLTSIFDELNVKEIDFISLDIEGYEVQALSGMNLKKYRPRIFIIEYKDEKHKSEVEGVLFQYRYSFLAKIGCNLFYGTEIADADILKAKYGKIQLVAFDKEGKEEQREVGINLSPSIAERVKFKIKKLFSKLKS
jgi:FkbM family methyltransferase